MYRIGLDLSIKSTGICVWDTIKNIYKYYIIADHLTKSQKAFKHKDLEFIDYERIKPSAEDCFEVREQKKTDSIYSVMKNIQTVVKKYKKKSDVFCYIEGISYGSSSSAALADLSGLNYAIRCMLRNEEIPFRIIAPSQLKKFAVGNGSADKDLMTAAWKKCQPKMSDITEIKDDDIADAYFLSVYESI